MKLTAQASLQIQKPISVVFEAICNPEYMTRYFISESNGRLETDAELIWKFPEFKEQFIIDEITIVPNQQISFVWDPETVVVITFSAGENHSTIVTVSEGAKELSDENLKWLVSNSGGWANFLACLKAFLEHRIELRRGAYDFMKTKN